MNTLRCIATKLNNTGVFMHERGYSKEATKYFREALAVMMESETKLPTEKKSSVKESEKNYEMSERRCAMLNEFALRSTPCQRRTNHHSDDALNINASRYHGIPTNFSDPIIIENSVDNSIERGSLCDDNLRPLIVIYNMALMHVHLTEFETAVKLFEVALTAPLGIGSHDPMTTAIRVCIHHNLGIAKRYIGDEEGAVQILFETHCMVVEAFGKENLLAASTLNAIGQILVQMGFITNAMELFHEALQNYEKMAVAAVLARCCMYDAAAACA